MDARGAVVSARRRPGLRIRVPPEAACMPTRVTCRVARRQRDGGRRQPLLGVGDGLATHVLEMGPVGEQFSRCVPQYYCPVVIAADITTALLLLNQSLAKQNYWWSRTFYRSGTLQVIDQTQTASKL